MGRFRDAKETAMNIVPYLWFDGTCREAFGFYETVLGGKIVDMLPHAGTPMSGDFPADWQDKIMHASIKIGDAMLMGSDAPPAYYRPAQGLSVSLHLKTAGEAERVFAALAEGGSVTMPLEKTFWTERFGMLVDRFGIPWMINCEAAPA